MPSADLHFYFDPICPFAWMTSTWVRQVMAAREYSVDWRFISLRLVNADVDYDAHFPPNYEFTHTLGLRLLRMAALGSDEYVARILAHAGLPGELAAALDDSDWDKVVQRETDEALSLTGKDVGTPILHVDPPDGVAFFGPVISRRPSDEDAVELWDHVLGLARYPGFSELKRSLRERLQLPVLGVKTGEVGTEEDWHQGSRFSVRQGGTRDPGVGSTRRGA
jgi:hypothetical protein